MKSVTSWNKRAAGLLAVAVGGALSGVTAVATPASAATCSNVDVVFARGTLELPGLGIVGGPFVDAVKANLPGQ
ncbi:MAG: cutinase family protein, partial [Frankia sp.]